MKLFRFLAGCSFILRCIAEDLQFADENRSRFISAGDVPCEVEALSNSFLFGNRSAARCFMNSSIQPIVFIGTTNISDGYYNDTATRVEEENLSVIILQIFPLKGPEHGQTHVKLIGNHFTLDSVCCFGEKLNANILCAKPFKISPKFMICITPTSMPGTVPFFISSTSIQNYVPSDALSFEFTVAVSLLSITPCKGSFGMQHLVVLLGINFLPSDDLSCRFGKKVVPAIYISSTQLTCYTPEYYLSAQVPVEVSNNGVDFEGAESNLSFMYVHKFELFSVEPPSFPIARRVQLVVKGMFYDDIEKQLLFCKLGSRSWQGSIQLDGSVLCETPDDLKLTDPNVAELMMLSISINGGYEYQTNDLMNILVYPDPVLHSVHPSIVPETGGSVITLTGEHFYPSEEIICKFGNVQFAFAKWISNSKIRCITPSTFPKTLKLSVSSNSQQSGNSSNYVYLQVHEAVTLSVASPSSGSVYGATLVTLYGTGFHSTSTLFCRFGGIIVQARVINSTALQCSSPPSIACLPGKVLLDISANGGNDYSESKLVYLYTSLVAVGSIIPNLGPQDGFTVVEIHGNGFSSFANFSLVCKFGSYVSPPGKVMSDSRFICISPALPSLERTEFIAVTVKVVIAVDEATPITADGLRFTYYPDPVIESIYPAVGSEKGGTQVTLSGRNFINSDQIQCFFGHLTSSLIRWVSSSTITCMTPEPVNVEMLAFPVSVRITLNGQQKTKSKGEFRYLLAAHIVGSFPAHGTIAGGTLLRILGSGFLLADDAEAICIFDNIMVKGIVLSFSELTCITPAYPIVKEVNVAVNFNGGLSPVAGTALFSYTDIPTFLSITPSFIPIAGGVTVSISGKNFGSSASDAFVLVNHVIVPMSIIDDCSITFVAPQLEAPSDALIRLATNGVDYLSSNLTLKYHSTAKITSVSPPFAHEYGGTKVYINGTNFVQSPYISCIFIELETATETIAPASFISANTVACEVPAVKTSLEDVLLEISFNGCSHDFHPSVPFYYRLATATASVFPDAGPLYGGTNLSVAGSSFPQSNDFELVCVFYFEKETQWTKASIESHELLKCTAPPAPGVEVQSARLTLAYRIHDKLYESGLNNHGLTYVYYNPSVVIEACPFAASSAGGVEVLIHGHRFRNTSALACRFTFFNVQFIETSASYISSEVLKCVSPTIHVHEITDAKLEIADNGADAMSSGIQFIVFPYPRILAALPPFAFEQSIVNLTIIGLHFIPYVPLYCSFFKLEELRRIDLVLAEYRTTKTATCNTSMLPPGTYNLSLVTFEQLSSKAGLQISIEFVVYQAFTGLSLHPSSGPLSGLDVMIKGVNFPNTSSLSCKFGDNVVSAEFVSHEEIVCRAPTLMESASSHVEVSVSGDGIHFFNPELLMFRYSLSYGVTNINPPHGQPGEIVVISGADLSLLSGTNHGCRCRFNFIVVSAIALSDDSVSCVVPKMNSLDAYATVELSVNGGRDFSTSNHRFFYKSYPRLTSINPSKGPVGGGTLVLIEGRNFYRSPLASCRFGNVLVRAAFISANKIGCNAPESQFYGTVSFGLSLNDLDWTSQHVTYTYFHNSLTLTIQPTMGSTEGGDIVTLRGEFGRFAEPSLFCSFGSKNSLATILSSTMITCMTPQHQQSTVSFDIINAEGLPLIDAGNQLNFQFFQPITISKVHPWHGSIQGGTRITLSGSRFSEHQAISILFNLGGYNITQEGGSCEVYNETAISCDTADVSWLDVDQVRSTINLVNNHSKIHISIGLVSYVFRKIPDVESFFPVAGIIEGGETVEVIGKNGAWLNTSSLSCFFGHTRVRATWLSPRILNCVVPRAEGPIMKVPISVTDNDFDFSFMDNATNQFTYEHPATILSVEPHIVPHSSSSMVIIHGRGFSSFQNFPCFYQEEGRPRARALSGSIRNDSMVKCEISALSVTKASRGSLCVQLKDGSCDYSFAPFHFIDPPIVTKIWPSWGYHGIQTLVTIIGKNFKALETLSPRCSFSDLTFFSFPAVFVNDSTIQCNIRCPLDAADMQELFISFDGKEYSTKDTFFSCDPLPHIASISPDLLMIGDTSNITMKGKSFRPRNGLSCGFYGFEGLRILPLFFVSEMEVLCHVEKPVLSPEVVQVHILSNGVVLSSNQSVRLEVVARIRLMGVSPSTACSGSSIRIQGYYFYPSLHHLWYKINQEVLIGPVTALDSHTAVVRLPSGLVTQTNASLAVSLNGLSFSSDVEVIRFSILARPRVYNVYPNAGPITGGTTILLRGSDFSYTCATFCLFNNISTVAVILSEAKALCITPRVEFPGIVRVAVSNEDDDDGNEKFYGSLPSFHFFRPILLTGIEPAAGPLSRFTTVMLRGRNFDFLLKLNCKFGDELSPATIISETSAHCVAPLSSFWGQVSVALILEQSTVVVSVAPSPDDVIFTYFDEPVITSIVPSRGSVNGGDLVSIQMSNIDAGTFKYGLLTLCKFGHATVSAKFSQSGTSLLCESPPLPLAGTLIVPVSISLNGIDFSHGVIPYMYEVPLEMEEIPEESKCEAVETNTHIITLAHAKPSKGPSFGGTSLIITGTGFEKTGTIICWFGRNAVIATYLSEERIRCISAPVLLAEDQEVAYVNITVTQIISKEIEEQKVDSQDFLTFFYYYASSPIQIFPASGPTYGNTLVKITGLATTIRGLEIAGIGFAILVRFETAEVEGEVVGDAIICRSPSREIYIDATVKVSISFGMDEAYMGDASFFFYTPPVLTSVRLLDGDIVLLTGSNFRPFMPSSCLLGHTISRAVFLTAETIKCELPSQLDHYKSQLIAVSLSMNGRDFTHDVLYLSFPSRPVVLSFIPSYISSSGGTEITFTGYNLNVPEGITFQLSEIDHLEPESIRIDDIFCVLKETCTFIAPPCPVTLSAKRIMVQIKTRGRFIHTGLWLTYLPSFSLHAIKFDRGLTSEPADGALLGSGFDASFNYSYILTCYDSLKKDKRLVPIKDIINETAILIHLPVPITSSTCWIQLQRVLDGEVSKESLHLNKFAKASTKPVLPGSHEFDENMTVEAPVTNIYKVDDVKTSSNQKPYASNISIYYFEPLHVPEYSEAQLAVWGENFDISCFGCLKCRVGISIISTPHVVNSTLLHCQIPSSLAHGHFLVSLMLDFQEIFAPTLLEVRPRVSLVGAHPLCGPKRGGTTVKLVGKGFSRLSEALVCTFGAMHPVKASVIHDNSIFCVSPSFRTNLSVEGFRSNADFSVSLRVHVEGANDVVPFDNSSDILHNSLVFSYYANEEVTSIWPRSGSDHGNTMVKIQGSNFFNTSSLSCRIGASHAILAEFVNNSLIMCNTPMNMNFSTASVVVSVANNGIDFDTNQFPVFHYFRNPSIMDMSPTVGPFSGETAVIIQGRDFPEGLLPLCRFGKSIFEAEFSTDTEVSCLSPVLPFSGRDEQKSTLVSVSISFNGLDFIETMLSFHYIQTPLLFSLTPKYGPSFGNNKVIILGANLKEDLVCRFDNVSAWSRCISDDRLECIAPPHTPGSVIFHAVYKSQIETGYEIQTLHSAQLQYVYLPEIIVTDLIPRLGSKDGGTSVIISGRSFVNISNLCCLFNETLVPLSFVSESQVRCVSPRLISSDGKGGLVAVRIGIEHNGYLATLLSSQSMQYRYTATPYVKSITPTRGIYSMRTRITLIGENFIDASLSDNVTCYFDATHTSFGLVTSDTTIDCHAPIIKQYNRRENKQVRVTFSPNDFDFFGSADGTPIFFTYYPQPIVLDISPDHGTVTGGTVVSIHGLGFPELLQIDKGRWLCLFGDVKVDIYEFVSSDIVRCKTPAAVTPMRVAVTLMRFSTIYENQMRPESNATYTFVHGPIIRSVFPTSLPGKWRDGRHFIAGENFFNSSKLSCQYSITKSNGSHIVSWKDVNITATYRSSQHLECNGLPALDEFFSEVDDSWATGSSVLVDWASMLRLTTNGIDWSNSKRVRFISDIFIKVIEPRLGSRAGKTLVAVTGSNFFASDKLFCKFGNITVIADYRSPFHILCLSPPNLGVGITSLPFEVTNNGYHYTSDGFTFTYHEPIVVSSPYPAFGPSSGGTMINFEVALIEDLKHYINFGNQSLIGYLCKFNQTYVTTAFTQNGTISCTSPEAHRNGGEVLVELSINNGADWTSLPRPFLYLVAQNNYHISLEPTHGPSQGSTLVEVKGLSYSFNNALQGLPFEETLCKFGYFSFPATAVLPNENSVICESPPRTLCALNSSAAVEVRVSLNGAPEDFTPLGAIFTYDSEITLEENIPNYASAGGGTKVRVVGGPFFHYSSGILCRFGESIVNASYVNSDELLCEAPRHNNIWGGPVKFGVSLNNGHDFAESKNIFNYIPIATVTQLFPRQGPISGGTLLKIQGHGFTNYSTLCCTFEAMATQNTAFSSLHFIEPVSTYVSSTEVFCKVPPWSSATSIFVTVSNTVLDLKEFSSILKNLSGVFTYYEIAHITKTIPSSGPSTGNFSVRVFGGPFIESNDIYCRFGEVKVKGIRDSANQIRCVAPHQERGIYALEVTLNDQDYTRSYFPIEFHSEVYVSHIFPVFGPALSAGTAVSIFGVGFNNSTTTYCRFGNTDVPAFFINDKELLCKTPTLAKKMLQVFSLGNYSLSSDFYSNTLIFGRVVQLDVTINGQDYTNSGRTYLYYEDISVVQLSPDNAPLTGGTPVFIEGKGFINSTFLTCKFGSYKLKGTYITSTLILCFAPSTSHFDGRKIDSVEINLQGAHPNEIFVEVSNNGVDYTNSRRRFMYVNNCKSGSYQPGFERETALICPRGAYCRDGASNFTLCPEGTYQAYQGQSVCSRCPVGYICPERGLPVPRICPAGYVCDVTGLQHAAQLCPAGHFCIEGTASALTFCGNDATSNNLSPSFLVSTQNIPFQGLNKLMTATLGSRRSGCWNNATSDFGLQLSDVPARIWAEYRLLPLDSTSSPLPIRGHYCLDDSCLKVLDREDAHASLDLIAFEDGSTAYKQRRPIPCPSGMYCAPGTAFNEIVASSISSAKACIESMYCPEASDEPSGFGECPIGFYCPFAKKIPCPIGNYCPRRGSVKPTPCPPGTFNGMVSQSFCTNCPIGYICPGHGRVRPAICPPGFVCSKISLESPNQRCPPGFYCPNGTQTSDPFRNDTTLRPYPCTAGSFCPGGVAYDAVKENHFLYSQPCAEGFFCELASTSAKGSGLCPRGFTCPKGTALPRPTPKGSSAELFGTVRAAKCLPGTFAPTIESEKCYPCAPGTYCDREGVYEPNICGPGTFQTSMDGDETSCLTCPTGTWSKNWGLREAGECIKCPTGVACLTKGSTSPCSVMDLPTPYEPVLNLNGLPVPEYEFSFTNRPPSFTIHECLKLNDAGSIIEQHTLASVNDSVVHDNLKVLRNGFIAADRSSLHLFQEYFFGELLPPFIDVLGRGPHFRACDEVAVIYSRTAKCYRNSRPSGSILYQRMQQYFGARYDRRAGSPSRSYTASHAAYNCTPGFYLLNESLTTTNLQEFRKIKYTDPARDVRGQRSINGSLDQFYPGTCEADFICADSVSQATPCKEGFVCDEATGLNSSKVSLCMPGYYCPVGTTPDTALTSSNGQFLHVCPAGYICKGGTGLGVNSEYCMENYFCPAGTADPLIGSVADDSFTRKNFKLYHASIIHVVPTDEDIFSVIGSHDLHCRYGIDNTLQSRYQLNWPQIPEHYSFLASTINATRYPALPNLAVTYNIQCARDHKISLVTDAVRRNDCNCVGQMIIIISVYRLWKCTAAEARREGDRPMCKFNDSASNLTASLGRVPYDNEKFGDGFGGRQVLPSLKKGILANSSGFLAFDVDRDQEYVDVGFFVQFTWDKKKSFSDYQALRTEVRNEYRLQHFEIEHNQRATGSLDPFTFDLNHAINLVERFGKSLESVVYFREKNVLDDDYNTLELGDSLLVPGRLDICACQNMLKCPNGTRSKPQSQSIDDCTTTGDLVLRRVSIIPALCGMKCNGTFSGTERSDIALDLDGGVKSSPNFLELNALELVVVTLDLSGLPRNMTYNDHYRISVYENCSPCQPLAHCEREDFKACCLCQPHPLPTFFQTNIADSGFLDDKHQPIQISITALEHIKVEIAVELLHGSYDRDFELYFKEMDRMHCHVFTPSNFNQRNESDKKNRFMWMSVLEKDALNRVPLDLPLNLPQKYLQNGSREFENRILIDRISDINVGDKFWNQGRTIQLEKRQNSTPRFNSFINDNDDGRSLTTLYPVADDFSAVSTKNSWWESGDSTPLGPDSMPQSFHFIALPYLPFFSNCRGYDSHVGISHLLQDHPLCSRIEYEDTITVNPYSFLNGPKPLSDFCLQKNAAKISGIELSCLFEEDFQRAASNFRWYEAPSGATLFRFTRNAIDPSHFEAKHEDGILFQRWGRSQNLENLLSIQQLIPVIVEANKGGFQNSIPRVVKLNLPYYQVSKGEKRLVRAGVSFENFCTTLRPKSFGGNNRLLDSMLNQGILPCDVDIEGNPKSMQYTLEIAFYPLDWASLFNAFEFDQHIYLGFSAIVGTISATVASLIWCTSRLLTNLRHIPTFHGWKLAKMIAVPSCTGCILAVALYFISVGIVHLSFHHVAFASQFISFPGDWLNTYIPNNEALKGYELGRMGIVLIALGFYLAKATATVAIPKEEKSVTPPTDVSLLTWRPHEWKRCYFIGAALCITTFFAVLLEFSYSTGFDRYFYYVLIAMKLFQSILNVLLQYILKENMMVAPLMVAYSIVQHTVITFGAPDFLHFMYGHFVFRTVGIFDRLYLNSVLQSGIFTLLKWKSILGKRSRTNERCSKDPEQTEKMRGREIDEFIERSNSATEMLISNFSLYSVEITGYLLSPFIGAFLALFFSEIQMSTQLYIPQSELVYYACFELFMIPWNSLVDVIILNSLELIHGWRVYDFIAFLRHRFAVREHKWAMRSSWVDQGISEQLRAQEKLCFSSQYYFILAAFALGIMNILFGLIVILRSANFNSFGDPLMPGIFVAVFLLCELVRITLQKIAAFKVPLIGWFGLWEVIPYDGIRIVDGYDKLRIGTGRKYEYHQEKIERESLSNDQFRQQFLKRNRPWILQHLVHLITPACLETVGPTGQSVLEYIRDLYAGTIKTKGAGCHAGSQSDTSSDDEADEGFEERRRWSRAPLISTSLAIAELWLSRARKRRIFYKSVSSMIQNQRRDCCQFCLRTKNMCETLIAGIERDGLLDSFAIDDIIRKFELRYTADENNVNLWKAFFRSNTQVVTACNLCVDEMDRARRNGGKTTICKRQSEGDFSDDEEEESVILFDPLILGRQSNEFIMVSKWLAAARKKLGGSFPREKAKEQTELYVKLTMNRRVQKKAMMNNDRSKKGMNKVTLSGESPQKYDDVRVNSATKTLAQKWFSMGKSNVSRRFLEKGAELRKQLGDALLVMTMDKDWFYGEETRALGLQFAQEGDRLLYDRTLKESERASRTAMLETNAAEVEWRKEVIKWLTSAHRKIQKKEIYDRINK